MINYKVEIDSGRDATYGQAIDDITSRVMDIEWTVGMDEPYQDFAPPARLSMKLDNRDRELGPDRDATYAGVLLVGTLIRVRAEFDSTWHTLWEGKLTLVSVPTGISDTEHDVVYVEAQDPMMLLLESEFTPELMTNVTVDQAIQAVFDTGAFVWPYDGRYWVLGASLLGEDTYLLENLATELEPAGTTLMWVGDVGGDSGTRVQQYLRWLVAAEGGGRFFYQPRTGQFVFQNRYHDADQTTPAMTLRTDEQIIRLDPDPQPRLKNDITVEYEPRVVGAADSILAVSDNMPLQLAPGHERRIILRYRDPDNPDARVGGLDVTAPVPGSDLVANSAANGSGLDMSAQVGMAITIGARQAEIVLVNSTGVNIWVQLLRIRGTPLTSYNRAAATAVDAESIRLYDRQPMIVSAPAISSADLAQNLALYTLARFSQPLPAYMSVTIHVGHDDETREAALSLSVGDVVRIIDEAEQHNMLYAIVGERHMIDMPDTHHVTWVLQSRARSAVWLLDDDEMSILDETTILGF